MPPKGRDDAKFVELWIDDRWAAGVKVKTTWEEDFEIPRCKQYWLGNQLEEPEDENNRRRVQINKVHPSVKASIPSLYFHDPFARVEASPALSDTPGQTPEISIDDKAILLQDTGNTFIRDSDTSFDESSHDAMKEAHWSFGCVRVMCDSVPVENPAAESIPMMEHEDTIVRNPIKKRLGDFLGLTTPAPVKEERFYVKRIPSRQIVVSADQSGVIKENAWIGYWSVHYVEDVKRAEIYKNTKDLKASGVKTDEDPPEGRDKDKDAKRPGKIKLYHIWDQRGKWYLVFADEHKQPIREVKYKRLPLKFIRFDTDPDRFYPIPPIYHMLHPQDETNESRDWLRKNRDGTVARYTVEEGGIDPSEMAKLEDGSMGTYVWRKKGTGGDVIMPVNQPNYSSIAAHTLNLAKEEFDELSLMAGEQRGVPESKTATQAKIMDVRSQVQESFDRSSVAKFLGEIVEEIILLAVDKMSLSKWILKNADPYAAGFPVAAQQISEMWRQITHKDLEKATDGLKWSVVIEPGSMSPVAEHQERMEWNQAIALITNPIMTRLLAISPEIRKKHLTLNGIKSAREQELIGQAMQAMVAIEREMTMMGSPGAPGMASMPGSPPGGGSPATAGPPGPPGGSPEPGPPPSPAGGAPPRMGNIARMP